jgi:hypothetical protein
MEHAYMMVAGVKTQYLAAVHTLKYKVGKTSILFFSKNITGYIQ